MVQTYFSITENCNLKCGHCFCSACPDGQSISLEDGMKVLEHVPEGKLIITGGEPFTERELLYGLLEYAQSLKKFPNLIVQTNGSWAEDEDKTQEIVKKLHSLGVSEIDIASNDRWHYVQKATTKVKKIEQTCEEYEMNYHYRGSFRKVKSVGRARSLNPQWINTQGLCSLVSFGDDVRVNRKGQASACCYMIPLLQGSLVETPWEELVRRNVINDDFFNELASNSRKHNGAWVLNYKTDEVIRKFAKYKGFSKKEIKRLEQRGICELCSEVFEDYNVERGIK